MIQNVKGQSTIEFFILVGFIFFVFLVFLFAVQSNIANKLKEGIDLEIKEIAKTVQDEVSLAVESSDGYLRNFKLPNRLGSIDYNISIIDNLVYVRTYDGKHALALPVLNVTGQPLKGDNFIRKFSGGVYLNS